MGFMHGPDLLIPRPEGLYCPPGDFFIDPVRPVPRALVTHAHADHARAGHGAVLATRETLDIMALRVGDGFCGSKQAAEPGRPIDIGGVSVAFHPAGHVLGSAQIAVECHGFRIVAAGDYARAPNPTCAAFEPVACDVYITEATFGLPVFRHPPAGAEIARLLTSLDRFPERTHLVGVYALGKAQRLIRLLRDAGHDAPIFLHGALRRLCDYYAGQGIALGDLRDATINRGKAAGFRRGGGARAALGLRGDMGPAFRRPADRLRLGLDAGPRPRPAARRGTPARHLRSLRLGRPHADADRDRAFGGLGHPWPRGVAGALVRVAGSAGPPAEPRGLRRRGRVMQRFAALLDRLAFTPSRNAKLRLLTGYLASAPDPDRGWALAAVTRELSLASVKPAMLRALVAGRVDAELFALSYDFVGDLAETVALIWPDTGQTTDLPLAEAVEALQAVSRRTAPQVVAHLLHRLDASGRFALLKLVTGGLRVGVSARLAKQALADLGGREVSEIEELWHGLVPPYLDLFAWLTGAGSKPAATAACPFRPVMLATSLEEGNLSRLDPAEYFAEWKWDGIRVQASGERGVRRLYSRSGDDISAAFPDLLDGLDFDGTLDGELLIRRPEGGAAPFADLQQRLNRKTVSAARIARYPAFLRAYDLLFADGRDLREEGFASRRAALEDFVGGLDPALFDLSPLVPFAGWEELETLRATPPDPAIEGVMLKHRASAYVPGRPKGPWFKWKRDPHVIDAVLMYAQRGHGKRSGFYSDYTFGVWTEGGELVPVGKAYFGFTDEELARDRPLRARQYHRTLRPGALGARRAGARAGAGGGLRGAEPLDAPQVRRRHALPAHLPSALGQASRRGRPSGDAGGDAAGVDAESQA